MTEVQQEVELSVEPDKQAIAASLRKHAELISAHNDRYKYRGCFGLALTLDHTTDSSWMDYGNRLFIPDSTLKWVSVVDAVLADRPVHWGTVRPTTIKFGMPCLARRTETASWHLNRDSQLPQVDDLQLLKTFEAIEWAMTAFAAHAFKSWSAFRSKLTPIASTRKLAEAWAPKPYLAFPTKVRTRVFDWCIWAMAEDVDSFANGYPAGMLRRFLSDIPKNLEVLAPYDCKITRIEHKAFRSIPNALRVEIRGNNGEHAVYHASPAAHVSRRIGTYLQAGDTLLQETYQLPSFWYTVGAEDCLKITNDMFRGHLESILAAWFDRQFMRLKNGLVHISAELACTASSFAVDSELVWDVIPCREYYRPEIETFVFPPVFVRLHQPVRGCLPGGFTYDLDPPVLRE